jgi:hypothetical protein
LVSVSASSSATPVSGSAVRLLSVEPSALTWVMSIELLALVSLWTSAAHEPVWTVYRESNSRR